VSFQNDSSRARRRREIAGVVRFSDRRAPEQKRVNDSSFDDRLDDLFAAG
jgi:hypothetical protein